MKEEEREHEIQYCKGYLQVFTRIEHRECICFFDLLVSCPLPLESPYSSDGEKSNACYGFLYPGWSKERERERKKNTKEPKEPLGLAQMHIHECTFTPHMHTYACYSSNRTRTLLNPAFSFALALFFIPLHFGFKYSKVNF